MEKLEDTDEELQVGNGTLSKDAVFSDRQIPEAIAAAQKAKKVLLVYIAGYDEDSKNMDQITWQDPKVHEVIMQNCVALRLVQGSTDAAHFSALYPCHECPIVTLISHTGALLSQWGGYVAPTDFLASLQQVAAKLQLQSTAAMIAALASSRANSSCSSVVENKSEDSSPKNEASSSNPAADESSAKLLEEESADDIIGSNSSCPEDRTLTHAAVDLPLKPREPNFINNRATPFFDELVPQSSRSSTNNEALPPNNGNEEDIGGAPPSSNGGQNKGSNLTSILLQIRLTNGEKLQHKFDPKDTLAVVKEFVDSKRTDGSFACTLGVIYPRRIFSHEEMKMSLLDLDLEDRATLVLVRNSTQETFSRDENIQEASCLEANDSRGSGGVFSRLISYFNPLSYLPGSSNSMNPNGNKLQLNSSETIQDDVGTSAGKKAASRLQDKNWGANIHTLQHDEDKDTFRKGNTFWNGNSTQYGGDDPKNSK